MSPNTPHGSHDATTPQLYEINRNEATSSCFSFLYYTRAFT